MRNPWLCVAIVAALALAGTFGLLGLVLIAIFAKDGPNTSAALTGCLTVATTALGALSAFLVSPPRGSIGMENAAPSKPPIPAGTPSQSP